MVVLVLVELSQGGGCGSGVENGETGGNGSGIDGRNGSGGVGGGDIGGDIGGCDFTPRQRVVGVSIVVLCCTAPPPTLVFYPWSRVGSSCHFFRGSS